MFCIFILFPILIKDFSIKRSDVQLNQSSNSLCSSLNTLSGTQCNEALQKVTMRKTNTWISFIMVLLTLSFTIQIMLMHETILCFPSLSLLYSLRRRCAERPSRAVLLFKYGAGAGAPLPLWGAVGTFTALCFRCSFEKI